MEAQAPHGSLLYMLERFEVGLVQLDRELRVVAMNDFARRVLPVAEKQPFNKVVLSFHPERSRPKLQFLIGQTECPVANPPPMTMIINIPERVLLIKVTKLADEEANTHGYVLVFYDITEAVSRDDLTLRPGAKRRLHKIPTVTQNRIELVDAEAVLYVRSEGHYTWIQTALGSHFCNLTIGDLEERLDPQSFLRIHRSYIVNLCLATQILREEGRVVLKLRDAAATELPVARGSVPRLMEHLGLQDPAPRRTPV
jgi:hypothetical protein